MLLGFLDGTGRAYDLTFGTLKRRLRDAEGQWELDPGESLSAGVSVEAALFLTTPRPHLLLRPTSGTAHASDRRLVFLAARDVDRTPEEPTRFNVGIHAPPTAVEHLFQERGGCEVVEVPRNEIRNTVEARGEMTLEVEARWMGGGNAPAQFALVLRPLAPARRVLEPLHL